MCALAGSVVLITPFPFLKSEKMGNYSTPSPPPVPSKHAGCLLKVLQTGAWEAYSEFYPWMPIFGIAFTGMFAGSKPSDYIKEQERENCIELVPRNYPLGK